MCLFFEFRVKNLSQLIDRKEFEEEAPHARKFTFYPISTYLV